MKGKHALLLRGLAAVLPGAQAQTGKWPERPVRVIVSLAPGGSVDIVARMVAARLIDEFGQQFVVDNRAGAGGTIGAAIVARASPDGYTLLVLSSGYSAIADLLSGQIQLYFAPGPAVFPHIKTGRLRAIAVSSEQRAPAMPDLPVISESVPGYSALFTYGMAAPAGTSREIVSRLNRALARILKQSDVQERLRADGLEPAHSTADEFARMIARDIAMWSKVVKAGNIKID